MQQQEQTPVEHGETSLAGTVGTVNVFGVPLRFHFTFLLLLVFLIVLGTGGQQSAGANAAYIAALFASVLLHELGHTLVARRYGIGIKEIVMYPIGGVSKLARKPTAREEFWIAIAGPAVNLFAAGAMFGYLHYSGRPVNLQELGEATDSNLLLRLGFGNLLLATFNLLPAFPMDGGRILRSLVGVYKPEAEATRIAAAAGRWLAIILGLYGLLTMNFLLIFIAFFVYLGALQEGVAAIGRSLTQGSPVSAATVTVFETLSHGQTIRDAAKLLLATTQQDFPVMHGDQVLGLLGRHNLLKALAANDTEGYVAGAMEREFVRLSPEMDLSEALTRMPQARGCALVMDGERLLGLLTTENLSEFLLLRRFGMNLNDRGA